jgi:hypothetical protein
MNDFKINEKYHQVTKHQNALATTKLNKNVFFVFAIRQLQVIIRAKFLNANPKETCLLEHNGTVTMTMTGKSLERSGAKLDWGIVARYG